MFNYQSNGTTESQRLVNAQHTDVILLADRGFDITESVGLCCAEVKIPAFTKGKKQLSPLELESTRKIAHSRIHVERFQFQHVWGCIPCNRVLTQSQVIS
jgi:hypothetical protein